MSLEVRLHSFVKLPHNSKAKPVSELNSYGGSKIATYLVGAKYIHTHARYGLHIQYWATNQGRINALGSESILN